MVAVVVRRLLEMASERSGVPEPEATGWAAVAVGVVVVQWEAAVAASLAYT